MDLIFLLLLTFGSASPHKLCQNLLFLAHFCHIVIKISYSLLQNLTSKTIVFDLKIIDIITLLVHLKCFVELN